MAVSICRLLNTENSKWQCVFQLGKVKLKKCNQGSNQTIYKKFKTK